MSDRPRDEDASLWPLHQRVVGASIRAVLTTLGFTLPFAPFMLRGNAALPFVASVFVFVLALLLAERRDVPLSGALGRVAGAGAAAAIVIPFTILWAEHLGDPRGAYQAMSRLFARGLGEEIVFIPLGGALGGLVLGLPLLLRSRTAKLRPLVAGAVGQAAVPLALCVAEGEPGPGFAILASFVAATLGLAWGDALARRYDPSCPSPIERPLGPAFVAWVLFAAVGGCFALPGLFGGRRHGYGNETAAIGALKTISTSQSIYREGDKDGNNELDYAGNLSELSETQLIDTVLGSGQKQGYFFRLIRSSATPEFLWAAAADPIAPGVTGDRWFFVNQAGAVFYTTSGPIPFTDDLSPPDWVRPIGK